MKKKQTLFPLLVIIVLAVTISIVIYFLTVGRAGKKAPSQVIQTYLAGISSYQNISRKSDDLNPDLKSAKAEALGLFFNSFSCKVLSQEQDQMSARVRVRIRNVDTDSLARDIRKAQYKSALVQSEPFLSALGQPAPAPSLWELIRNLLTDGHYPLADEEGVITLTHRGTDQWILDDEEAVTGLASGHLLEKLKDPYLVRPEEILEIYLGIYRDLDESGWEKILDLDSLLSPYGAEKETLSGIAAEKIKSFYDYALGSAKTDTSVSSIPVTITSIDLSKVLALYREKLESYGDTFESITGGSQNLALMNASFLEEALNEAAAPGESTVTIQLENDGTIWQVKNTAWLTDALLGGISRGLDVFSA